MRSKLQWCSWGMLLCLMAGVSPGWGQSQEPEKKRADAPVVEDISPNTPFGKVNGGASTSGLTVALAGDTHALYAVSLNAGIWKAVEDGPWKQLPNSPPRACCIAVDPNNPQHLAVGERNGLAREMVWNEAGIWESRDAGEHWTYTLNPLATPGCTSQAVPAVAFSRKGTLFVGTAAGVGRKVGSARAFDFSRSPAGVTRITAFAVSESKIWARTRDKLLVSANDGLTWSVKSLPTEVAPYAIAFRSRGDAFSLAAFDTRAFLVCKPNPDSIGNRNTLLIYDLPNDRWQVQKLDSGDGTGLGGRRFVKSYVLRNRALKPGIGGKLQLFYGAGQEVHQALGVNPDGTIQWDTPVQTSWAGPPHPTNQIHSDLWDLHIAPDFGPGPACAAWIACDGGVFKALPAERSEPADALRVQRRKWVVWSDGLHTHHIHTLTVLPASKTQMARLAYPTSDNDAWFWNPQPGLTANACWANETDPDFWKNENSLGDVNWSAGDWGNRAVALVVRRTALAVLNSFGEFPPTGADFEDQQVVSLNTDETFDGPLSLQFIQTLAGETPEYPLLDAVMLARLPLRTYDAAGKLAAVPGPLGEPNPDGGPVLLRTTKFAAAPDANRSHFANWQIEAKDLPKGTRGVWVSGGHLHPTYYLFALEAGSGALYKRVGAEWKRVELHTRAGKAFSLLTGGWNGPAFVDPYNPDRLWVLTPSGVKLSLDGGDSFDDEPTLTALLTDSGKYPLTAGELTGNGQDVILATRAIAFGTLAHMAFNRDHPGAVVAASPFTGVFYASDGHTWRSLTPYLPRPLSAVSAVGLDHAAIYVATEGRSMLHIRNYAAAPLASFFTLSNLSSGATPVATSIENRKSKGENPLATLRNVQVPLAGCAVQVRILQGHGELLYQGTLKTDAQGRLFAPSKLPPGQYSVLLRFDGNSISAPATMAESWSVAP
ncbi:MAG TPA: hypothetical protein VKU00_14035 [Chthonomonadaceae bacterium]|nr:hypothetical protein [Chthonomonadaceae bacterium]